VGENGRLDEVTGVQTIRTTSAPTLERCPFINPFLDKVLDLFILDIGNHRTNGRICSIWIAYF